MIFDGLSAYRQLPQLGYEHEAHNIKQSPKRAHALMPVVHRIAALLKRWKHPKPATRWVRRTSAVGLRIRSTHELIELEALAAT